MRRILNQAKLSVFSCPRRIGIVAGLTATVMTLGIATAFGTAPSTSLHDVSFQEVIERVAVSGVDRIDTQEDSLGRESRIRQGDTLATLLNNIGVDDESAKAFLREDSRASIVTRQLAPGKMVTAQVGLDGRLQSLSFPLNGDKGAVFLLQRVADGFSSELYTPSLETRLEMRTATVRHSLFGAADDADIPEGVAIQLAEIFGSDIDFHRDLRKGDRFSVVYETQSHQANTIRSQRVIAAEFLNGGKTYRAFWHQGKDGKGAYYNEDGKSVRKAFLRSPLEFSRITSGFSNARYHPVLRETRAHRGIDYGAPTGTRVRSTGDGVITLAGNQGGYGKVVMIRHAGETTTVYGHLSGFAAGIRNGARVSQGDVIGYVGATGIATGPHLHYEFRIAGVHRNPLTLAQTQPSAAALSDAQASAFKPRVEEMLSLMSMTRSTAPLAMLD